MNTNTAICAKTNTLKQFSILHEQVQALDLEAIKFKLVFDPHGTPWSVEKVTQIEILYKRFLVLVGKHPDKYIVPFSEDVDTFWHYHILDTGKYSLDCTNIFGRFIHHFPYLGLRGAADAESLQKSFEESCSLYEQEFGVSLDSAMLSAGCTNCAPAPSCSGDPSPTINQKRPSLKEYLAQLH
jgi:hypothetical protein